LLAFAPVWDLGAEHLAGTVPEMALKYTLQGRKQGESDLGEGRAGVVRKCLDSSLGGDPVVRACKCISKRQQSQEETERELSIMRKLVGVAGVCQVTASPQPLSPCATLNSPTAQNGSCWTCTRLPSECSL
jgi:hypothetical protein